MAEQMSQQNNEQLTLPWLRPLWKQLVQAQKSGRLSHAPAIPWLPELGSDRMINTLAKWLLCSQNQSKPCGQCKSCRLWDANTHPDFLHIAPVEQKQIGVDAVRAIQKLVQQKSSQHGSKVIIVQQAEQLTVAAANALLKTLEEPSEDTYLIVAPQRYSRLLATVRSRITQYDVPRPDTETVRSWLYHYSGQNITDAGLLERAQQQPLRVYHELTEADIQAPAEFWDCVYYPGTPLPKDKAEIQLWLDRATESLRSEHRNVLGYKGQAATHRATAEQLARWSKQACKLKQQLQQSGLNIPAMINPWLSQIRKELND